MTVNILFTVNAAFKSRYKIWTLLASYILHYKHQIAILLFACWGRRLVEQQQQQQQRRLGWRQLEVEQEEEGRDRR